MTAPQEKAIREALPVVAWRDDGLSAANGTEDSSYRVVTDKTKQNMPRAAMEAYTDALVLKSDAEAQLAELRAEVERLREVFVASEEALDLTRINGSPRLPRLFNAVENARCSRSGG